MKLRIKPLEIQLLEDLFQMGDGYVLHFSNKTFSEFFEFELDIDIYDDKYSEFGDSKAKRLRCFLQKAAVDQVIEGLKSLWEYRAAYQKRNGEDERIPDAAVELGKIIVRLGGEWSYQSKPVSPPTHSLQDRKTRDSLKQDFVELGNLDPQPRGYAFEKFLKKLFDVHGLEAHEAFRIRGEQIDGSFYLNNETYLLEARWRNQQADASDLHAFHGKLEQKAAWTRGLFISHAGFSVDGLHAFGRGKRLICMNGLDLYHSLEYDLPIGEVISRKRRRFAETGVPFVMVRDLFTEVEN